MSKKQNKKPRYRTSPYSYPKSAQELVKVDYWNRLSNSEKDWLGNFNEAEFGGNPQCLKHLTKKRVTKEEKRAAWRRDYYRKNDSMNHATGVIDIGLVPTNVDPGRNDVENAAIDALDRKQLAFINELNSKNKNRKK